MSHRSYDPPSFFRRLTAPFIALLAEAIARPLTHPSGGRPHEQALAAYKSWPETEQQQFDRDVRPIHELSTSLARRYVDEVAERLKPGDTKFLAECRDSTVHDLTVRLWVLDRRAVIACHQEYAADNMANFDQFIGRYPVDLRNDPAAIERLRHEMNALLRARAGGRKCAIQTFETEYKIGLYLFREGAVESHDSLDDDEQVVPLLRRDVVTDAAHWSHRDNILSVKARTRDERDELRDVVAVKVLRDANYFVPRGPRFDFGFLRNPFGVLVPDPALGITSAWVAKIVAIPQSAAPRVVIFVPLGLSMAGVHALAKQHGVDLTCDPILSIDLVFHLREVGRSRSRTVTFTNPATTNLNDTPRDRAIRTFVAALGITSRQGGN